MVRGSRSTISFPTNVRHPSIIRSYLRTLKSRGFDHYDEEFQRDFLVALAEDGYYTGKIDELSTDSKQFQGRVRYGYLKWFGFAWHDEDYRIRITPSGERFLEDDPNETWLKQMLKWQLPNPHHERRYKDFAVLPFVGMIEILNRLEHITFQETGIFYLPLRHMEEVEDCIRDVLKFRKNKKNIRDKETLSNFIQKYWKTKDLHVKNLSDYKLLTVEYPRSLFSYYQYTELMTLKGRSLILREDRKQDIDRILITVPKEVKTYKTDEEWYDFFGDYRLPTLPYENVDDLKRRLSRYEEENRKLKETVSSLHVPPVSLLEEVIKHYDEILQGDVFDPPTSLEWNTKRAFDRIGGFTQVVWNGQEDSSGNPSIHAGGGQPDIEIYAPSYVLVTEVTLSRGATQWRTETYSVPEHVDLVAERSKDQQTLGLFLAPVVNDQTYEVFWDRAREGRNCIIPFRIKEFQNLLRFITEINGVTPSELLSLLRKFSNEAEEADSGRHWRERSPDILDSWKNSVNQKRQVYRRMFKIYEFFTGKYEEHKVDMEFPFDHLWMSLRNDALFLDKSSLKTTLDIMASLNLIQKNGNFIRAPIDDFELALKRFVNILKG
jgi:hypothetical protein